MNETKTPDLSPPSMEQDQNLTNCSQNSSLPLRKPRTLNNPDFFHLRLPFCFDRFSFQCCGSTVYHDQHRPRSPLHTLCLRHTLSLRHHSGTNASHPLSREHGALPFVPTSTRSRSLNFLLRARGFRTTISYAISSGR